MTNPLLHVYVYPHPADPNNPPPPLLSNQNAYMVSEPVQGWQINATSDSGLTTNTKYDLTVGQLNKNNKPSTGTCTQVAPPSYFFAMPDGAEA
ncbi:hypothetical protein [Saccharothrix deserti]|uniref:hypothetical protein n=1 Tax=Saccharothrix deserti TaxID=2593674 RepID=UPI00131EA6C7|nr:hypothetical protein [Saccharothrix deserti]